VQGVLRRHVPTAFPDVHHIIMLARFGSGNQVHDHHYFFL
jgi:hypothetical protein